MPWYRIPCFLTGRTGEAGALAELASSGGGLPGGVVHINFGRAKNKRAPLPCCCCGWISTRECDWSIAPGRTCDNPLCDHCTTSPAPGKDICPAHVGPLKAWFAGRTNTVDGAGP